MSHEQDLAEVKGKALSAKQTVELKQRIAWASDYLQQAKAEVLKDIFGQDDMVNIIFTTMVAGGNVLAEGMPGLAKTRTIRSLGRTTGLTDKRIQFTPDLQPIDITGSELVNKRTQEWELRKGPVFAQLLLADEINRASEKTQAGMLEAMEEKRVTIDGTTHDLPVPFIVMATQNPVDQGGTNKLPEAQADRFLMKALFNYASYEAEKKMAISQTSTGIDIDLMMEYLEIFEKTGDPEYDITKMSDSETSLKAQKILSPQIVFAMQKIARKIPISDSIADAAVKLARALRPDDETADQFVKDNLKAGPSPRSEIGILLAAKALVLTKTFSSSNGKLSTPTVKDIIDLAIPVMGHRLMMKPSRPDPDITSTDVIKHVLSRLDLS